MKAYKIVKPIIVNGAGYITDKNGVNVPMQQLAPKLGDIILGDIETKFVFYQNMTGIFKHKKCGDEYINWTFIPEDSVEIINNFQCEDYKNKEYFITFMLFTSLLFIAFLYQKNKSFD